MLRIFILSLLILVIQSLKPYLQVDPVHDQVDHDEDVKLTQEDKKWDEFYRKSIPGIGQSKLVSVTKVENATEIEYKDIYENGDYT